MELIHLYINYYGIFIENSRLMMVNKGIFEYNLFFMLFLDLFILSYNNIYLLY